MWTEDKILTRIKSSIVAPLEKKGLGKKFGKRLDKEFPNLWKLFHELYGNRYDCLYQLEDLISMMAEKNMERSIESDLQGKKWFASRKTVAMMLYVDLFNVNLKGLEEKLDYFEALGINAIHLMPLFHSPEGESDGGYAVSDYQEVRKDLGSMKQLSEIALNMRERGMHLIVDFILNHTSDEHEWARKALKGEEPYCDYYFMFETREEADRYDRTLREIFPTVRRGSFTFREDCGKWIWTTFNNFQWDLNYSNPEVFRAMSGQMLFLSNHGADVLRLDALAFTWKEIGTDCENLPKAHSLIKLFRSVAAVAAPELSFLSEAIVHPDDVIKYISADECELSYNPLQMATSWEAMATRNTSLLKKTFSPRFSIPQSCRWVNYIRCHDDIGWTFCDEDAASLGIDPFGHRSFLNSFYTGRFEGSFASGIPFQENLETGDARISGTLASLAGLEKAMQWENAREIEMSMNRIKLLTGFILSLPGVPLLYSGDELALLNDYSYLHDKKHAGDSRWVHRLRFPWDRLKGEKDSPSLQIHSYIKKMIELRGKNPSFDGNMVLMDLKSTNLMGFRISNGSDYLIIILNFTERPTPFNYNSLRLYGGSHLFTDLLTEEKIDRDFTVKPYAVLWLEEEDK